MDSRKTILIGICDDEDRDLERIETAAREGFGEFGVFVDLKFDVFSSGEDLHAACWGRI